MSTNKISFGGKSLENLVFDGGKSEYFYFNAGANTDWYNVNNWYKNSTFTTSANELPGPNDIAVIVNNNVSSSKSKTIYIGYLIIERNIPSYPDDPNDQWSASNPGVFALAASLNIDVSVGVRFRNYDPVPPGEWSGQSNNAGRLENYANITCPSIIMDSSNNYGTLNGSTIFRASAGDYLWKDVGVNYGTINGTVLFEEYTQNSGTINSSNATFQGASINEETGTIHGNVVFNNTRDVSIPYWPYTISYVSNRGFVIGSATFNSGKNLGTVTGNAIFNNADNSDYNINFNGSPNHVVGSAIFNGGTNYGRIIGDATFNGSSMHAGLIDGTNINVIFNDNSTLNYYGYSTPIINNAEVIFNDAAGINATSWNSNNTNLTFNDSSYNSSQTYANNVIFNHNSYNSNSGSYGSYMVCSSCTFNNNSSNQSSYSNPWGVRAGVDSSSTVFNDSSYNTGTLAGGVTFNNSSYSSSSGYLLNNSNFVFNDNSYCDSYAESNISMTFNNNSSYRLHPGGYPGSSAPITFNDNSYNSGYIEYGTFNGNSTNATWANVNYATLNNNSINYGYINNSATFNDNSINNGAVYGWSAGDITFNNVLLNQGGTVGDGYYGPNYVVFNSSSDIPYEKLGTINSRQPWMGATTINFNCPSITLNNQTWTLGGYNEYFYGNPNPSVIFNNSTNSGRVDFGPSTFNGNSVNNGVLGGYYYTHTFNDSSYNNAGAGPYGSGSSIENAIFNSSAYNNGVINYAAFNDTSYNSDNGRVYNATFNGSSTNVGSVMSVTFNDNSNAGVPGNTGDIDGNATFNNTYANRYGYIYDVGWNSITFNGSVANGTNYTVDMMGYMPPGLWNSGRLNFNNGASFTLAGTDTWNFDTYYTNFNGSTPTWTFNDSSSNYGYLKGDATFNGSSYNTSINYNNYLGTNGPGAVAGNATFNDYSYTAGGFFYGNNINFYDYSYGYYITSSATPNFYDTSMLVGSPYLSSANFYNSSSHNFTWWSNYYSDNANLNFYDTSLNNNLCSTAAFSNSSTNIPTTTSGLGPYDATFYNTSTNNGNIRNSATFYNSSRNDDFGYIVNGATFNDTSINSGRVNGAASFNNESTMITGYQTPPGSVNSANFNNSSIMFGGSVDLDATFNDYSRLSGGTVVGTATFNGSACVAGGTATTFVPDPPPSCPV